MVDELFFPMLQLGHDGFHMGANLLLRPAFACHVLCAEIDQLLLAGIGKFSARVAPLAVFLVERAVGFTAEGGILQRHSAALADQLSAISGVKVPKAVEEIRTAPVLHDIVVDAPDMPDTVKKVLGIY